MKGILIFLAGLVGGGALTFFVAVPGSVGLGVATGMMAGACVTVETAKDLGLITAEQVDQILTAAAEGISKQSLGEAGRLSGGDAECQTIVDDIKAATAKAG